MNTAQELRQHSHLIRFYIYVTTELLMKYMELALSRLLHGILKQPTKLRKRIEK